MVETNWDKSPILEKTGVQEIPNFRERNRHFYWSAFSLQPARFETLQIPTPATHSHSPVLNLAGQVKGLRTSSLPHTFCPTLISLAERSNKSKNLAISHRHAYESI